MSNWKITLINRSIQFDQMPIWTGSLRHKGAAALQPPSIWAPHQPVHQLNPASQQRVNQNENKSEQYQSSHQARVLLKRWSIFLSQHTVYKEPVNSCDSDVCPKCPVDHPPQLQPLKVPPQHKKLGLSSEVLGPKGALFYHQLHCCRISQDGLLRNNLVGMNRLQLRSSECQWKWWEESSS